MSNSGMAQGDREYVIWGILFSLVIHLFLVAFLMQNRPPVVPEEVITVDLVTEMVRQPPRQREAPPEQIVSPPQLPQAAEPPLDTRLRSDIDASTPREQIRRGIDPDAGPDTRERQKPQPPAEQAKDPAAKAKQREPETKQKAPAPDPDAEFREQNSKRPLKHLSLDAQTMRQKYAEKEPSESPLEKRDTVLDPEAYQAFSRPSGSGARFIGKQGNADHLPNLPDGDITLLNTKADQFAVFVRRVATQVFSQIRQTGWDFLNSGDIRSISTFTKVRAVLSVKGELLRIQIEGGSGSTRFDEVIAEAVRKGARDQNPPPNAVAADGNIHFIFQAKSWSKIGASRSGAPTERRWLLLATGLD